jgi:hypothetical protein
MGGGVALQSPSNSARSWSALRKPIEFRIPGQAVERGNRELIRFCGDIRCESQAINEKLHGVRPVGWIEDRSKRREM